MIIVLGVWGVVISMVVGMFWYSPKTPMGKLHMQTIDQTADMKTGIWKYYLGQALLALLTSLFIAYVMTAQKGLGSGIIYGEVGLVWLCFTVPVIGQSLLWGNIDKRLRWKKFFSDVLSNLVTYFLIIFFFSFIV